MRSVKVCVRVPAQAFEAFVFSLLAIVEFACVLLGVAALEMEHRFLYAACILAAVAAVLGAASVLPDEVAE